MTLLKSTIWCVAVLTLTVFPNNARSQDNAQSEDVVAVRRLLSAELNDSQVRILKSGSNKEKSKLRAQLEKRRKRLPVELLAVAQKYPNTTGGLAALYCVAFLPAEAATSQSASLRFQEHALSADLEQLAEAISLGRTGRNETGGDRGIARVLLKRVEGNPKHAKAAELLTCVCRLAKDRSYESQANEVFARAAALIASHYVASPDITNFCEILGQGDGSPAWALPFENHLKVIIKANRHRHVRCTALFALASVTQLYQDRRQEKAAQLYRKFLKNFDGKYEYHFQAIERAYRDYALKELADLDIVGVGRHAMATVGVDLDGKTMKLSDYKGQVVLLSFWATWCSPCMEFIPHEKEIAQQFEDKQFAIVGINGDSDSETARKAVKSHGITWRSFRDKYTDSRRISETWRVSGWPTMYLIDSRGLIRRRWRNVSHEEITQAIAELLVEQTLGVDE